MQVVVCNQVGSLDQLVVEERPSPDLYPMCVRIAVCENLLFLPICSAKSVNISVNGQDLRQMRPIVRLGD